jgi:ParB-like chromosome segregation protein Spo0J
MRSTETKLDGQAANARTRADSTPAATPHRPITIIGIDTITVGDRMRKLQLDKVAEIAASIAARGLLIQPIVVRRRGAGYDLVVGHHRLEAARKCGHDTIRATILDVDADEAQFVEIDENLCRADLSPAERISHVKRRKELYERAHPEARRGATGRGRRKSQIATSNEPAPAFIDSTAKQTGKHRATIARDVARAKRVVVLPDIVGTSLDELSEIDALAKLSDIEQIKLADRAKSGEQVTAKQFQRRAREAEAAARAAYVIAEEALQTLRGRANGHGDMVTVNTAPTVTTDTDSSEALAKFKDAVDALIKDAVDALMPRMNREDLLEAHRYALHQHDSLFHDLCHAERMG